MTLAGFLTLALKSCVMKAFCLVPLRDCSHGAALPRGFRTWAGICASRWPAPHDRSLSCPEQSSQWILGTVVRLTGSVSETL